MESPTKAKTLGKFLGEGYEVLSSMGHIIDLPKKELGIDIEHDFTPKYEELPKKKTTISELEKAAKGAEVVFLATDPDREGEAIAWHIGQIIGDGKTKRVTFHEITEGAVKEAFEQPRDLNLQLVDSQQARRVLDRLVGYKLSPLLWKKIRYGLSAGRVQSVAVRLIVEREREREAFHPEEYWEVEAELSKLDPGSEFRVKRSGKETMNHEPQTQNFRAKLVEKEGQKVKIGSNEEADKILEELKTADYKVSAIEKSERKRNPYPPYTTSSLQQAGVNVLGFSAKRTMRAAQALYEAGLITYHRTDSTNLSEQALGMIREFIRSNYGSNYLPETANRYKTKVRLAQEAHEAIRPTRPEVASSELQVASDEKKVYELVWKQAVASQMVPSVREETKVSITASDYLLTTAGYRLIFDGWEKVKQVGSQESVDSSGKELPELSEGEKLKLLELLPSQHFTEPPARFTEATLIKKLEEEGIGRPSTYAPIISTIQERGYVIKDGRALVPEDAGKIVNDLLVAYFPDVVDLSFTAKMEEGLDEIARGEKPWVPLIRDFYGPFSEELLKAEENVDKSSLTTIAETDEKCPECGRPLIIKLGRYGKFYSCSGFPECKYKRAYIEKIGMKCPDCKEGDVIVKRTRRGKTFYGCSRYPECKFASWTKPQQISDTINLN